MTTKNVFSLLFRCMCGLLFSTSVLAQQPPPIPPKNIVALVSYDQALPWTQDFINGLTAEKKRRNQQIDFFFEFIDHRRLAGSLSPELRAEYLKAKYADRKIDAVLLESRHALQFVESQGEYVFGNVPYVLITNFKVDRTKLERSVIVDNENWLPGSAALLKRIYPGTERIVVVGGSSKITQSIIGLLTPHLTKAFPESDIQVITDQSLIELQRTLSELPDNTVVFYSLYFRAPNGARYIPAEVAKTVAQASSVPVFGLYDTYLGSGIVGGNVLSATEVGKNALNAALLLIEQGRDLTLPGEPLFSNVLMDARAMEQAGISEHQLPSGSKVLFRQPPFYEVYFVETISLFSFALVLVIALLSISALYFQKRKLSSALIDNQQLLEQRVEERTQELRVMATTDHLTGLDSRAEFYRKLSLALAAQAENQSLVVAILDIDNFKQINDRYGHDGGDRALKAFADCGQLSLRSQDSIGRIGGEEFACLLPNTDLRDATRILEQLRQNIAELHIAVSDSESIRLTTSIGLACTESSLEHSDQLMKQADIWLYEAKSAGKNRVCSCLQNASV